MILEAKQGDREQGTGDSGKRPAATTDDVGTALAVALTTSYGFSSNWFKVCAGGLFCRLSLAACLLPLSSLHAADIYLQIQRGEKVTIGFPDFTNKNNSPQEKALAQDLQDTAKNDILFTRLFNLQQEGPAVGSGKIDFEGWGKNGADILITANASLKEDPGKGPQAQLVASVFEVQNGNPVFQKSYKTAPGNSRRLAHDFVADFLYRFTGVKGVSNTKIAFSNNATGSKEIYTVDYDGGNLRRLTSDKSIALLPRWSPDGNELVYTSFKRGNPDLFAYTLPDGSVRSLSSKRGLNSAASFSPDGKIVATLSFEGSPSLYLLDKSGAILRRLTQGKYADTSPSFSPDGRKIVFVSDRPGWPQIYMMDADGSNPERISESGYCDAPSWSPRGDKIAYSRGTDRGKHEIVVQDLSSGNILQITENMGNNENPSFSPDGRFLVFTSTRSKKRELYVASVDGSKQKKLPDIPGDSFTPAWGP